MVLVFLSGNVQVDMNDLAVISRPVTAIHVAFISSFSCEALCACVRANFMFHVGL